MTQTTTAAVSHQAAMQQLTGSIAEWDRGAWCLAALRLAARRDSDDALLQAAQSVLAAAGLTDAIARSPFTPPQLEALASGSLLKAAALATGRSPSWADHTDETLLAQGQVSGASGRLFAQFLLPHLPGFAERLATPGARMLDVGTGVGALAVGFAQTFPQLQVTGIDVLERVLRLAAPGRRVPPAETGHPDGPAPHEAQRTGHRRPTRHALPRCKRRGSSTRGSAHTSRSRQGNWSC